MTVIQGNQNLLICNLVKSPRLSPQKISRSFFSPDIKVGSPPEPKNDSIINIDSTPPPQSPPRTILGLLRSGCLNQCPVPMPEISIEDAIPTYIETPQSNGTVIFQSGTIAKKVQIKNTIAKPPSSPMPPILMPPSRKVPLPPTRRSIFKSIAWACTWILFFVVLVPYCVYKYFMKPKENLNEYISP